jgi:uncharacterized membrane protein
MTLSDVGESRVRGYLFVLERSLGAFLPREVRTDAVREIESHLRERIAAATAAPDERTALERILGELGPPLRVAQAYSAERTIDEAVTTGRVVPMMRATWYLAVTTVSGFFAALGLLVGYLTGTGFLIVAALKPIFPDNVGIFFVRGIPTSIGGQFPVQPGTEMRGGYWVIPLALMFGLGILVGTHRVTCWLLARRRARRFGLPADAVAR